MLRAHYGPLSPVHRSAGDGDRDVLWIERAIGPLAGVVVHLLHEQGVSTDKLLKTIRRAEDVKGQHRRQATERIRQWMHAAELALVQASVAYRTTTRGLR